MRYLETRIPPPLVMLVFALAMFALAQPPSAAHNMSILSFTLIGCFTAIGLLLPIAGAISFRRASTTVNPLKPDQTTSLVTTGVYGLTRNPMYLGFAFLLSAWAIYLHSFAAIPLLLGFIAYIDIFQIKPEERAMRRLFPNDFETYAARVRRWV